MLHVFVERKHVGSRDEPQGPSMEELLSEVRHAFINTGELRVLVHDVKDKPRNSQRHREGHESAVASGKEGTVAEKQRRPLSMDDIRGRHCELCITNYFTTFTMVLPGERLEWLWPFAAKGVCLDTISERSACSEKVLASCRNLILSYFALKSTKTVALESNDDSADTSNPLGMPQAILGLKLLGADQGRDIELPSPSSVSPAQGLVTVTSKALRRPVTFALNETTPILADTYTLEIQLTGGQAKHTLLALQIPSLPSRATTMAYVPEGSSQSLTWKLPRSLGDLETLPRDLRWANAVVTVFQSDCDVFSTAFKPGTPQDMGPTQLNELISSFRDGPSSWIRTSTSVSFTVPGLRASLLPETLRNQVGRSLSSSLLTGACWEEQGDVDMSTGNAYAAVQDAGARILHLCKGAHYKAATEAVGDLKNWIEEHVKRDQYVLRYMCVTVAAVLERDLVVRQCLAAPACLPHRQPNPGPCCHVDGSVLFPSPPEGTSDDGLVMVRMDKIPTFYSRSSFLDSFLLDLEHAEMSSFFIRNSSLAALGVNHNQSSISNAQSRFSKCDQVSIASFMSSILAMQVSPTQGNLDGMKKWKADLQSSSPLPEELQPLGTALDVWSRALELEFDSFSSDNVRFLGLKPAFNLERVELGVKELPCLRGTAANTLQALQELLAESASLGGSYIGISSHIAMTAALVAYLSGDTTLAVSLAAQSTAFATQSGDFPQEMLSATHEAAYALLIGASRNDIEKMKGHLSRLSAQAHERGCPSYAVGAAALLMEVSGLRFLSWQQQKTSLLLAQTILEQIHHHLGEARCFATLSSIGTDPLETKEWHRRAEDSLDAITDTAPSVQGDMERLRSSLNAATAFTTFAQDPVNRHVAKEAPPSASATPDSPSAEGDIVAKLQGLLAGMKADRQGVPSMPGMLDMMAQLQKQMAVLQETQANVSKSIDEKRKKYKTIKNLKFYEEQVIPMMLEEIKQLSVDTRALKTVIVLRQTGDLEAARRCIEAAYPQWLQDPIVCFEAAIAAQKAAESSDPKVAYFAKTDLSLKLQMAMSNCYVACKCMELARMGAEALRIVRVVEENFGERAWQERFTSEERLFEFLTEIYWAAGELTEAKKLSEKRLAITRKNHLAELTTSANEQFTVADYLEAGYHLARICVRLFVECQEEAGQEDLALIDEALAAIDPCFGSLSSENRSAKVGILKRRQQIFKLETELETAAAEIDVTSTKERIQELRRDVAEAEAAFLKRAAAGVSSSLDLSESLSGAISQALPSGKVALILSSTPGRYDEVLVLIRSVKDAAQAPVLAQWRQQTSDILHRTIVQLQIACDTEADMSWRRHSRDAAEMLFPPGDPIGEVLCSPDINTIYVMQQGFLQPLPFHTLLLGGSATPVGIQKAVVYFHQLHGLPDALADPIDFSTICMDGLLVGLALNMRRNRFQSQLLKDDLSTYPELPSTEREVDSIAKIIRDYKSSHCSGGTPPGSLTVLKKENAVKEKVLSHIGKSSLVHVASHCWNEPSAPMLSEIGLSGGDNITLEELFVIEREAPLALVTLSACDTGNAQSFDTHIGGFVYALLHLGSRLVIVSMQETIDDMSSSLMDMAYTRMAEGAPVEEALRHACEFTFKSTVPAGDWGFHRGVHGVDFDDENETEVAATARTIVHDEPRAPHLPTYTCCGCGIDLEDTHWQRCDGADRDLCGACYHSQDPVLRPPGVEFQQLDADKIAVDSSSALHSHPSAWAPFTLILNTMG